MGSVSRTGFPKAVQDQEARSLPRRPRRDGAGVVQGSAALDKKTAWCEEGRFWQVHAPQSRVAVRALAEEVEDEE